MHGYVRQLSYVIRKETPMGITRQLLSTPVRMMNDHVYRNMCDILVITSHVSGDGMTGVSHYGKGIVNRAGPCCLGICSLKTHSSQVYIAISSRFVMVSCFASVAVIG